MKTSFSKYQATGNDFILFDATKADINLNKAQIKALCDRNFGIGADGLIIVRLAGKAPFFMDYYNSDGSEAEMCGNGIRCVAAYILDSGLIESGVPPTPRLRRASGSRESKDRGLSPGDCPPTTGMGTVPAKDCPQIKIDTRAGIKVVESDGHSFAVGMGAPSFDNQAIGFKDDKEMWEYKLDSNGQLEAYGVSIGNPHCIIFSENLDAEPVHMLGPIIENHPLFENRINVEWVKVKSDKELEVRVWERGAGLTLACGTGACAAFAVANRLGLVGKKAEVYLPGGQVTVELQGNDLVLKGEAKFVFSGEIKI